MKLRVNQNSSVELKDYLDKVGKNLEANGKASNFEVRLKLQKVNIIFRNSCLVSGTPTLPFQRLPSQKPCPSPSTLTYSPQPVIKSGIVEGKECTRNSSSK